MMLNILGMQYQVIQDEYYLNEKNLEGETDYENKIIRIKNKYNRLVFLHELVHAYLYESGLEDMSYNELLVDWIAHQFDKIGNLIKDYEANTNK